uniref:ABC transporter, ATP-binding protein n=1 Tax=Rhabditophanes sp. KR3021 TaxID=114890 RepID=A0AC35TX00_9BILA
MTAPKHTTKNEPSVALDMTRPTSTDEDEDTPQVYAQSTFEKVLNILLCNFNANKVQLTAKPVTLFGLFRYANKLDWIFLFIGFITCVCTGASLPVLAIISGRITNALLVYPPRSTQFRDKAYENVYIFLGIGVFTLFMNYLQYMLFQSVCNRVISRMRKAYMKSILRQNAGWFDKNQAGVLTTRLNDNIERIREGLGDKLGLLIRGAWMFISACIIAFIYEWRLALMMFGITPMTCFVMSMMSQFIGSTTMKILGSVGQAGAIAEETILGVRTVQSLNGQEERIGKYEGQLNKGKKYALLNGLWGGLFGGIFFLILFVYLGCGMLYGGWLLKVGIFDQPGDIFIVVMSMLLGAYFLGLVSPHLMVLLNARVSAATIYQTIDRVPQIDCYSQAGKVVEDFKGKIELRNVHFRYPTRKEQKILHGVSFTVNPGETCALVGHSGCGKSTSVGLITRLYECESGEVLIDGVNVKDLNIDWLRNSIGIVQQEPVLFSETLAENLRMGKPNITKDEMIECCRMANAEDFVSKLPNGYDTLLGEGGVQLSGGQKQRIAIARTLARGPKVLLLDEATSALDTKSEKIVQAALDEAAKGRTTIIIAHRLSTIKNADKIIVFDAGNIIEQGTHDELVALGGSYAGLVKAQQIAPEPADEEIPLDDDLEGSVISSSTRSHVYRAEPANIYNRKESDSISFKSSHRSSVRSGRDAFMRGVSHNESFGVSNRRMSTIGAADPAYALSAIEEMELVEDEQKAGNANILTIYRHAHGNYIGLIVGFIIGVLRGFELPGLALLFTHVFKILGERNSSMVGDLAITVAYFSAVGLGTLVTQLLSSVIYAHVSESLTLKYRVDVFRNILYQDAGFFDVQSNSPGELITRLASDVPNVRAVIDGRMLQVIYGVTAVVTCIALGYIYSWQVTTTGLGLLIILAVTQIGLAMKIQNETLAQMKNDKAGKISIEAIEYVRTVQLLTRADYFNKEYGHAVSLKKASEFKKSQLEAINFTVSQTFQYFMLCICYAVGIRVIFNGDKSSADVFQAVIFMLLGAVAVMNAASYFPEFVKANTAAKTLFKLMFVKPATGDHMAGEKHDIRGNIMFDNIKFTYPARKNQMVMNGLHFSAQKGQTVALVGPSGSGKSTTISLLERFYDPVGGFVRFDGKDVKTLSLHHLRSQMGLVGQEPKLFSGTIKENICLGLENVSMERIEAACELANCNFLKQLPDGLDTEVGEKGGSMSGGMKQRICIARCLVREPKILLLDESTSALDSKSEKIVQEALDKAAKGRTTIVIAHRLSSIVNSDLIVYIADGKVMEQGTHSQLLAKKALYYELIQQQSI